MNKRLLLVDDDIDLVELFARHLRVAGFDVDVGYDGEDGLELIKKNKYNLILLDVMMTKVDGLSFLEKAKGQLEGVPVVMLTNLSRDGLVDKAVALGAIGFINKTDVDPGSLEVKVKGFLGE